MKHTKIEKVSINQFEDTLMLKLPTDVVVNIIQSQRNHPNTRRAVDAMEYFCEKTLVAIFIPSYRYGYIYADPIVDLYGSQEDIDNMNKEQEDS